MLPKRLVVYVTAKDIRDGVQGDPNRCPIARATRRAVLRLSPHLSDSQVETTVLINVEAYVYGKAKLIDDRFWHASNAVREWIAGFDLDRDYVKPARFVLT